MSKVDWSQHKNLILGLDDNGLSSAQIVDVLRKNGTKFPKSADRTVRKLLCKWRGKKESRKRQAKVLIYDIETSRIHVNAKVFSMWNQNLRHEDIEKPWIMLCFCAKWLWEDGVMEYALTPEQIENWDDSSVTKALWDLFDEADIIIAHNNRKFDQKVAQTRFFAHRLHLPSPFTEIDTLVHARKKFKVPSNRLDYLGDFLGVGRKIETEKGLWDKVENNEEGAMDRMVKYNVQDVLLLERVYLEMRPYIQPHPNIGLHEEATGELICPSCGGTHLEPNGEYHTTVQVYQNYTCNDCGSHSRSRKSMLDKDSRDSIMSSVPK